MTAGPFDHSACAAGAHGTGWCACGRDWDGGAVLVQVVLAHTLRAVVCTSRVYCSSRSRACAGRFRDGGVPRGEGGICCSRNSVPVSPPDVYPSREGRVH